MMNSNRSLHNPFVLHPDDETWVHETITRTHDELRATAPAGRAYDDSVRAMLERDRHWVRWKAELCPMFEREPWSIPEVPTRMEQGRRVQDREPLPEKKARLAKYVGMWEDTKEKRETIRQSPPEWEHKLGSAPLTEIWAMGYRSMADLEMPAQFVYLFLLPRSF
jgi:hypothetical protein